MSLKACAAESVWRRSLAAGAMFSKPGDTWGFFQKQPVHVCGVDM